MYINLIKQIDTLKIKKKDIANILDYGNQKALSIRLNGKTTFRDDEISDIYLFLKKNGYKGSKETLFEYSEPIKVRKKTNSISNVINMQMNKLGLKNKDILNYFHSINLDISKNTISNWRNGKNISIRNEFIDPLCELLKVSPLLLLGYSNIYESDYINKNISNSQINIFNNYSIIYDAMLNILLFDDDRYLKYEKLFKETKYKKEFISTFFNEDIYPLMKNKFDECFALKDGNKTHSKIIEHRVRFEKGDYYGND